MTKKVTIIQSVDRALTILNLLADSEKGLGVTEISNKLEVSKSTSFRLLSTLMQANYVKQDDESQKYFLGTKLLHLGQIVNNQLDIRKIARPYMEKLANEVQETVHLVIQENMEIVYIDKIESNQTIRMYSEIGKRAPMYCTGVGKAILANVPSVEQEHILKNIQFEKLTDKTITNEDDLKIDFEKIKQQGFSIDDEEHERGIKCAAAPIFDANNKVVAGISFSGPTIRVNDDNIEKLGKVVAQIAHEISQELGSSR